MRLDRLLLLFLAATLGGLGLTACDGGDPAAWDGDCASLEDGQACPDGFEVCALRASCPTTDDPSTSADFDGFVCRDGTVRAEANAGVCSWDGDCAGLEASTPCPAGFSSCVLQATCPTNPSDPTTSPDYRGYVCRDGTVQSDANAGVCPMDVDGGA